MLPGNYASLISKSGLPPEYYSSLPDTVVGFDYDIRVSLANSLQSPFTLDLHIQREASNLDALLVCDLRLQDGTSIEKGISFLRDIWNLELAYTKSENQLEVYKDEIGRDILHALTLSPSIAMSVKFRIQ